VPTILIARHAQASFGAENYDVLSTMGATQAEILAQDLALRRISIDQVVCGTLVRQRDTAAAVASGAPCDLTVDPRWDEYDDGDILTHHSTTSARQSRPVGSEAQVVSSREFQDLLEKALLGWIAAGSASDTAESWPAFTARVAGALEDVAAGLPRGGTAFVCTSAGVLAATCVALLGLPAEALLRFNRVSVNSAVTKVVRGGLGTTLISFNDHGHLERADPRLVTYR
jgi:broad specificity phosphatase PhoE